jgi:signal transduction histidine kinase
MEPYLHEGVELRKEVMGHPVIADVDPRRIQQVLVNLTKNALQATSAGAVTVGLEDRGETVAVIVRDTGPGMSPDVIQKLFQPFFTTKPKEEGTGLGLAFAKSVVGAHGGTIEVLSLPGQGSTFTVVLPKTPSPP